MIQPHYCRTPWAPAGILPGRGGGRRHFAYIFQVANPDDLIRNQPGK